MAKRKISLKDLTYKPIWKREGGGHQFPPPNLADGLFCWAVVICSGKDLDPGYAQERRDPVATVHLRR